MCVRPAKLNVGKPRELRVPCGQCIECRLRRSRDWAMRCVHEMQYQESMGLPSWFWTGTYADEFLPVNGSLDRRVFPLFAKSVRQELGRFRYFHAGEYGEKNGRPHYHALLFGLRLNDVRACGQSQSGYPVFESAALSALWPHGTSQLGHVSFESAQYVARYCVEKIRRSFLGVDTTPEYGRVDFWTGKFVKLEPEYATMSRGNGIPGDPGRFGLGYMWWKRYREEVYRDDAVVRGGAAMQPPRFYDKKEVELDEARMEVVKARRIRKYGERCTVANGVTWRTNAAREAIAVSRLKQLEERRK